MAVNPAVGAGFDGPPPSLPAPKVPKRAGEFTAHPAAPSPYRVRARGACRATPHPEIHILSSWALGGVHGGDIRVKPLCFSAISSFAHMGLCNLTKIKLSSN